VKLNPHVQQLEPLTAEMWQYLKSVASTLNLDDPNSLTKEEAFYDACNRYDSETAFFNAAHNYYSGVLPSAELTERLKPYHARVLELFPDHTIFRSQVVRNVPGRIVHPHIDPRLYHRLSHRVHAVLTTNDHARHVYFEPDRGYTMSFHKMEAGYIYDFDNITPHAAFNLGTTGRLHVITDVIPNSDLEKNLEIMQQNPNFIEPGVESEYYHHLKIIGIRYGNGDKLRAIYERNVA
jgi:hypothetical protein